MAKVRVEKVIVVGAPIAWFGKKEVLVLENGKKEGKKVELAFHNAVAGKSTWAVVKDPGVGIGKGWKIDFS